MHDNIINVVYDVIAEIEPNKVLSVKDHLIDISCNQIGLETDKEGVYPEEGIHSSDLGRSQIA